MTYDPASDPYGREWAESGSYCKAHDRDFRGEACPDCKAGKPAQGLTKAEAWKARQAAKRAVRGQFGGGGIHPMPKEGV